MRQVVSYLDSGACVVEDVPAPALRPRCVLVRNEVSLISAGTEGGTVKLGQMGLLGKARARPEQLTKVIQVALRQGPVTAYEAARRALEMPVPLGYSSAGRVIGVGAGIGDIAVGDRVACAGAGFANHAEVVCVPRNLVCPVPEDLELEQAAFTTVASIALQSLRVADVRLGEQVAVIGLGLVGVLTTMLLQAAGCRTYGIDLNERRLQWVRDQGLGAAGSAADPKIAERALAHAGPGAYDAVIISAATPDNAPVELAGLLARRKGRVVVVGRTEMHAPRETYLFKELQLLTSMAGGPGTGDPAYELEGIDYPHAYVRWTENRNMTAVLELMRSGRLDVRPVISHRFDIDAAPAAFALIGEPVSPGLGVLLEYPPRGETAAPRVACTTTIKGASRSSGSPRLGTGVIGAGSHATTELLPALARHALVEPRLIASATGLRAKALGRRYGFAECASDAMEVIADPHTDCVFVLSRHDTHAGFTAAALAAGKHVFVEKPLALTTAELQQVREAQQASGALLMVGFNRRFAPLAQRLRVLLSGRQAPVSIIYRANVGFRPPEHWLHHPGQGGGVVLGEACHHLDFCRWLAGAQVESVTARTLGHGSPGLLALDNTHIDIHFADGSHATVVYVSNGGTAADCERIEVHCEGQSAVLTDFRRLDVTARWRVRCIRRFRAPRGHAQQIDAFLRSAAGTAPPLDVDSYFASSELALQVHALALQPGGAPT